MNWKALILCGALFAFAFTARSAPITYKEIAMLLRNGETPQSILQETASRKLLQPLTQSEEAGLLSLGGTAAMVQALRAPAMIASSSTASAYEEGLVEQKRRALQQQKNADLLAAQAAPTSLPGVAAPSINESADKPMELKFISIDGTPVDLANMRGKVVLIDFWATWCGPCMMEVPEVVAVYNKYHDKGFEIIGISLDQSRDAVLKTTEAKGMTWQQYFDGKGWKNELAVFYGIHSIPAMWLVNKQGILATRQARGNLDEEIEKLLAE